MFDDGQSKYRRNRLHYALNGIRLTLLPAWRDFIKPFLQFLIVDMFWKGVLKGRQVVARNLKKRSSRTKVLKIVAVAMVLLVLFYLFENSQEVIEEEETIQYDIESEPTFEVADYIDKEDMEKTMNMEKITDMEKDLDVENTVDIQKTVDTKKVHKKDGWKKIEKYVNELRSSKTFYTPTEAESSEKSSQKHIRKKGYVVDSNTLLVNSALTQLGYQQTNSILDKNLMWIVAPHLDCQEVSMSRLLNRIPRLSPEMVIYCKGGDQWVNRLDSKDVFNMRIKNTLQELSREHDCPKYTDFIPPSFPVNHGLLDEDVQGSLFILKGDHHSLPKVTNRPFKLIKQLKSRAVLLQTFIANPLLWQGKKFSIRTWAFIASSYPLVVTYQDGVVFRSLEPYSSKSAFANITTRQHLHRKYAPSMSLFCMSDLQNYLNTISDKFVEAILVPYLKRLMLIAIHALRRDHATSFRSNQQMCFDFIIDADWNVWLLDTGVNCDPQIGDTGFRSACKNDLLQGMGSHGVSIIEQLLARKSSSSLVLAMFDESVDSFERQVCKRKVYQEFRDKQTFSKRVIRKLIPDNGKPLPLDFDSKSSPKKCPVCGYLHTQDSCQVCGSHHEAEGIIPKQGSKPKHTEEQLNPSTHIDEPLYSSKPIQEKLFSSICTDKGFEIVRDTDAIGVDIGNQLSSNYESCCVLCSNDPGCIGFSFSGATYQCWLKSSVLSQVAHANNIVGVKASNAVSIKSDFRQELLLIFSRYDPSKVSKVDALLARYKGNEERFIQRTRTQYERMNIMMKNRYN